MLVKLENPAVVQPQSFPHCIPTLHGGIKRTDPSLIAVHELTVDINDQIAISLIEFLEHGLTRIALITQILLLWRRLCQTPSESYRQSPGNRATGCSAQSTFVKLFIRLATALINFPQMRGYLGVTRTIWL